jgi:hypothetical protein
MKMGETNIFSTIACREDEQAKHYTPIRQDMDHAMQRLPNGIWL